MIAKIRTGSSPRFVVPAVLILAFCTCSSLIYRPVRARQASQSAAKPNDASVQKLELAYDKPVVGAKVRVKAAGLPPGKNADLKWSTVSGGWVIENYYYFRGRKYSETALPLGTFPVSADGRLDATFAIPEDYGGVHDVIATIDGKVVAQNGMEVTQSFEMTPLTGPIGTPIELRVKGLGWRTMENTWVVNWDNRGLGFVTAAGTRGSAVARFRASGPIGDHFVKVYTGWQGQSYLNFQQAPNAYLPRPEFTFRTTTGPSQTPDKYVEKYQPYLLPDPEVHVANGKLSLSPTQGPVGTRAVLRGEGFPSDSTLDLFWQNYVGSRVSGNGFSKHENLTAKVKVGSDGKIEFPLTIPEDLGGEHGVELRDQEKSLGRVYFAIETTIVSMEPLSGPAGTPITIHLKGVGWTEYDNMFAATYDNAYMGYACGFNSQGDVVITFRAAGEPGTHLIDLFPGIYQGPPTENQLLYRMPQLTYADDHPGNKIPALHFKFEVTR
jgi:hypothetical protein